MKAIQETRRNMTSPQINLGVTEGVAEDVS
jgi:hypothetical protein